MTLSHCWGRTPILTLTHDNLEAFENKIEWTALPKTFRDAVTVTSFLGIKYLWIDSLCIIQGCEDDWRRESMMMGHVYKRSHCNIAADFSVNSQGGLFISRDPRIFRDSNITIGKQGCAETLQLLKIGQWGYLVNDSPLNRRAWVMQERLLAPRALHFTNEQLCWECRSRRANELFPCGIPDEDGFKGLKIFSRLQVNPSRPNSFGGRADVVSQVAEEWRNIVCKYAATALTKEADKLVAISGLAREIAYLRDADYLAGLWTDSLVQDMMWHTKAGKRPQSYRAPSWSWVSIDGTLDREYVLPWPTWAWQLLIEVVEAQTTPVADDPYAQVKDGYIRLRGFLRKARWAADENNKRKFLIFDVEEEKYKSQTGLRASNAPTYYPDDFAAPPVAEVLCLPMIWCLGFKKNSRHVLGLVLTPAPGSKGQFKRVGYFEAAGGKTIRRIFNAERLPMSYPETDRIKIGPHNFNWKPHPHLIDFVAMLRNQDVITII